MQGFKIVKEVQYRSVEGEELYMMLIEEDSVYSIRVDSRLSCLSHRTFEDSKSCRELFELFWSKVAAFKSITPAKKLAQLIGLFKREEDASFYFKVCGRHWSQQEIGAMIDEYKLSMKSKISPKGENGTEKMRILITLPGHKTPIGQFAGTFMQCDFNFQLNAKTLVGS
jgi:hypothetical protein